MFQVECLPLSAKRKLFKGGPLTGEDISFWVAQQVAISPCWYFANHTSRDDMLHEGHRAGHSPTSKSPAPAQPGTLAVSCISPVSLPVCKGRACHPILKSRHRFPLQFIHVQLSQHASGLGPWWRSHGCGGSSCLCVLLLSVLPSSTSQHWPEAEWW